MNQKPPPIVAGIIEGFIAPVLELVAAVYLSTLMSLAQTIGSQSSTMFSIFSMVAIFDFVRNIIIGLSRSQFAIGNLIGNIFGILIFYRAVDSISHEAANDSLLLMSTLAGSFILGLILTWYSQKSTDAMSYSAV